MVKDTIRQMLLLLLARGACIETAVNVEPLVHFGLLLARGACIETANAIEYIMCKCVAPRKGSMY